MFEFFPPITENAADNLSPITLAFVGDAVFSLFVRHKLCLEADYTPSTMQKLSSERVSARGQNSYLNEITSSLTQKEQTIFRRGRNAKKPSHSKNAELFEYNNATGLEAVIGWLYLTGQSERLKELFKAVK